MFRSSLLALLLALTTVAACSKKDNQNDTPTPTGSATGSADTGSAAAGSDTGSADTGSADTGSADTGSADTGSADAGSADAGSADAGSAAAGSGEQVDFDKLSHDDKVKFMKQKVMPAMKAAFQKFDPKEFANFTCKTCHGKDPQKAKYEMPTAELPKLDFDALKRGEDKEAAEFMANVVKPEMARILGKPEMTETNMNGFGCLHCHEQKK